MISRGKKRFDTYKVSAHTKEELQRKIEEAKGRGYVLVNRGSKNLDGTGCWAAMRRANE
jgi:hypothetical protein